MTERSVKDSEALGSSCLSVLLDCIFMGVRKKTKEADGENPNRPILFLSILGQIAVCTQFELRPARKG
jgi:hypothetical protein